MQTTLPLQQSPLIRVLSFIATAFGLLSIKEGGAIVMGQESAVIAAGNYVPFVVWFNFLAGFAYVGAGIGLWLQHRWAVYLAFVIAAATALAFAAFGVQVYLEAAYEPRTVFAMSLRLLVWLVIAIVAERKIRSHVA